MPSRSIDRALWFAVLAPPLAWSVDALASVTIEQDYCASQLVHLFRPWGSVSPALYVVGIAMLAISLYAGLVAWRLRGLGDVGAVVADTGRGATIPDRQRFMANAALLVCAIFSFGILLRAIAPLWIVSTFCATR